MTKLMEWLSVGVLFLCLWIPLLFGASSLHLCHYKIHIWFLPVYLVLIFGMMSAAIVLYRVFTFNDCPEAYQELKRQIQEAKIDLQNKGVKLNKTS